MYYNYNYRGYPNNDNRFVFPFLLGGLAGGALVGVTRPRPVYVNSYQPYPSYPYYPYYPYNNMPHGAYSNSYYGYY
mgnify:FL=1